MDRSNIVALMNKLHDGVNQHLSEVKENPSGKDEVLAALRQVYHFYDTSIPAWWEQVVEEQKNTDKGDG